MQWQEVSSFFSKERRFSEKENRKYASMSNKKSRAEEPSGRVI